MLGLGSLPPFLHPSLTPAVALSCHLPQISYYPWQWPGPPQLLGDTSVPHELLPACLICSASAFRLLNRSQIIFVLYLNIYRPRVGASTRLYILHTFSFIALTMSLPMIPLAPFVPTILAFLLLLKSGTFIVTPSPLS